MSADATHQPSEDHEPTQDEIVAHHEETHLDIEIEEGCCACGCGEQVSKKATFRMGHDQRFMGMLVNAYREGKHLAITRGGVMVSGPIMNMAADYLSATGQAKLRGYLDNASARPARSPKRWETDPDKNQDGAEPDLFSFDQPIDGEGVTEQVLGAPVRIKVGRWEYDATVTGMSQAGKVTAVEYQSKSGLKTAQDGKFTIVS